MQKIIPNLWFNRTAKEAVNFYLNIFSGSKIISTLNYPKEGLASFQQEFAEKVLTIEFEILGQRLIAINAGDNFKFNEAVSFMIECADQDEIDYYWNKLSASANSEQCGWCKDKYGLSWQIIPRDMWVFLKNPQSFQKLLNMKKIIIAELL